MKNDLISRSALKKAIDDYAEKRQDTLLWQADVMDIIDNAPTVEPERPQGEWVEFALWVAKEVLDDYFEDCSGAFAEIACRKLVKLGLVEVEDDVYKMKGGAE